LPDIDWRFVLDGADAVRFLKDIIAGLETFDETDIKLK